MTKPICNLQELTVQGHDIAELLRIEDPDGAHDGFDKFFLQRAKELKEKGVITWERKEFLKQKNSFNKYQVGTPNGFFLTGSCGSSSIRLQLEMSTLQEMERFVELEPDITGMHKTTEILKALQWKKKKGEIETMSGAIMRTAEEGLFMHIEMSKRDKIVSFKRVVKR